ncbi:MAG: EthD family reductase [Acidiferrobacterales bacterium]
MARMIVIYRTPADPAAFDKHYFDVHIPLAKKLPGLKRYEVSKGSIVALAGAADPYLVGTLHFDSLAAIKEAFASECGRACAADRRILAPDDKDVQMFLFEDQSVYSAT